MSNPEQVASTESADPSWLRELADANATLSTWLLLVFLLAGLAGFAAGLAALFAV